MMKNKIGVSALSHTIFNIKEWWRMRRPTIGGIKSSIKNCVDSFVQLYVDYTYIMLALLWILMNVLKPEFIVFNSFFVLCIACISIVVKYLKFTENKFYMTTDFSSAIKELDNLISDCIQEYMLMNDMQDPVYINDVLENRLREEVINLVIAKLSKRLLNKLTVVYNEEVVHKVIAIRVYIIIMRLVIEINKDKDSNSVNEQQEINKSFDLSKYMMMEEE